MKHNPRSRRFRKSAHRNDDEVSDDHPHPRISSSHSPRRSHGSKIPRAIKVPTPPITENNKSNKIETDVSSIIVMAPSIITESEILATGLNYVGFPFKSQAKTGETIKLIRFTSFFGVEPPAIYALFQDLREKHPHVIFQYVFMALNWLKLYETRPVMAGRWGFCEEHIAPKVKEYIELIQSLFNQTISFDKFHKDEVYIVSVDAVHFVTNEFRKDPSTSWFDFKNNGAGLTYEFSVALRHQNIVSVYGPKPAATPDITMFRGGNVDVSVHERDQTALYFKIPEGKYAVGDSGYQGEPSKIVCVEDGHDDEFKEFISRAKNRQESLHSRIRGFHVLSHCFRHGTSSANRMEYHQTCVHAVCVIVQYDMTHGHPLMEI